jgi:transposase
MRKTLFCGVDLHCNNAMYVITDGRDKQLFRKRLPNWLPTILECLEHFRHWLKVVAVESMYNWYWVADGLQDHDYPVVLANPAQMEQYNGIKEADDLTDAAFLARLARLNILPTGYIYPRQDRPVQDLLRRSTLVVQHRTALKQSLQNMAMRQTGQRLGWRALRKLSTPERTELLGDNDCIGFVASQQIDLIELLGEKIQRFEVKILEHAQLKPAYVFMLTLPGLGMILALTIMLETGDIGRFEMVGDYTSYCRCVRATRTSNSESKGKNNSKNGNRYLAWVFVETAHDAIRVCPRRKGPRSRSGWTAAKKLSALAFLTSYIREELKVKH